MKIQLILLFLIGTSISCSTDKEINPEHCPEKWRLIKMSRNFAYVPPATGNHMDWQEWYILYFDSTFTKTREQNNVVTEKKGTYSILTLSDGEFLELVYKSKNELVGNCTSDAKELLKFTSEDELTGTWWACDGPGLFYGRAKYNCDEQ